MTDIERAKLRRGIEAATEALDDAADAAAKVLDTLCIVLLHCGFSHDYIVKASADLGADWVDNRDIPSWREEIDAMRQLIAAQERELVRLRGRASK